jgi:outer membrane protein TolC
MNRATFGLYWTCVLAAITLSSGCSLRDYRLGADNEAYHVVAEKSNDPRWAQPGFNIELDPRSRYFDPFDPDCQPMPPDDPAAHVYMHCVDGKKGWPCWHCNGDRQDLENPRWRERLVEYAEITEEGEILLSLDSALRMAYIHSPSFQEQLETLYLSALDVTTERFRLDTQFFGGNTTDYRHLGFLRAGGEDNRLRTNTDFRVERRFATAGELLVGFANSFVWQFAGPNTSSALSMLEFNLLQPLLRGAGRDRALETLTRVERGLLSNLRQLERYRQGFYTNVAVGNLGVGRVSRLGGFTGGTGLTGFSGTGQGGLGGVGVATGFGGGFFGGGTAGGGAGGGAGLAGGGAGQVGGFIGLLQSLQEIRNTQYSLDLQLRTLALLEANLEAGQIDLVQVDQFRQNIETLRAQLLQARAGLEGGLDGYKTGILGLPPDLPVKLDDDFIAQFQLIDPDITHLQDRIVQVQDTLGELPPTPDLQELAGPLEQARNLLQELAKQFDITELDLQQMAEQADTRKEEMTDAEQRLFDRDLEQVAADFEKRPGAFSQLENDLNRLSQRRESEAGGEVLRQLVGWTRRLGDELQSLSLIQARARLEAVVLEETDLDPVTALQIARANRLDYMNNRAALVDSWRLIAFNADQLQAVLDVQLSGDIETRGNNPAKFRAPTGSLTARLEFDAPFTRLLERNNYRQALVDYQQSRRQLIRFDDSLNQGLRAQLRNLAQLRANLEIQRRAVIISIRRVDFTRAELNRPLPSPAPGAPPNTFGPTAVQNLLSALSDLSNAQNNFMSVWLNYYAGRMQLMRDLGVMQLDEEGRWIDLPLSDLVPQAADEPTGVPPAIPQQWWEGAEPLESVPPQDTEEPGQLDNATHSSRRSARQSPEKPSANLLPEPRPSAER